MSTRELRQRTMRAAEAARTAADCNRMRAAAAASDLAALEMRLRSLDAAAFTANQFSIGPVDAGEIVLAAHYAKAADRKGVSLRAEIVRRQAKADQARAELACTMRKDIAWRRLTDALESRCRALRDAREECAREEALRTMRVRTHRQEES